MLEDFWKEMKSYTWVDNLLFSFWWNGLRTLLGNTQVALPETARRYWSWAQLACTPLIFGGGTSNLYIPHLELTDTTFLNPFIFPHGLSYDYWPLKDFLANKIAFPIKTRPGEPRLLVVSVDVKDCTTVVTFDSYASVGKKCDICYCNREFDNNNLLVSHMKEDHIKKLANEHMFRNIVNMERSNNDRLWYSLYGEGENNNNKHVVFYDGIGLEQLTAGCMIPQSIDHPSLFDYVSNENRTYWDGGLLSNTPLRELLQRHKDYWLSYSEEVEEEGGERQQKKGSGTQKYNYDEHDEQTKIEKTVPDLEVYIIDLFPAVELDKQIPSYGDIIQDRINDIRFHDRTVYDEKVALLVSDYVSLTNILMDLCKRLLITNNDEGNTPISQINLARQLLDTEENGRRSASKSKLDNILINFIVEKENNKERNSENVISRILGQDASSYHRTGKNRKYSDLLTGTFNVEVTRLERQDDPNTISGKIGDFSHTTITDLMQKGEQEAKIHLKAK
jgi:NTE family protein